MKKIICLIIIIIKYQLLIYSQPSFTNLSKFGTRISSSSDWGDYDNDGDLDLVVGNIGQNLIYINEGNGNFIDSIISDSLPTNFVKWIDIDDDDDIDLFIGNYDTNPNYIYYNQGNGNLVKNEFIIPYNITDIDKGDFDEDGDIDIVITCWGDDYSFILLNNGNNEYLPDFNNEFIDAASVAVFDVDNDNDLDIIFGAGCCIDSSKVYKNDGTGLFSLYSCFGQENAHMSNLSYTDVDNDGDVDITSGTWDSDSKVCIYINDGNGDFSCIIIDNINFSCSKFGDIDNDNDIDLVVGAYGFLSDRLAVYLNNNMSFEKSTIETGGYTDWPINAISDISLGDADGDGDLDISVMRFIWTSEFDYEGEQNTLFINNTIQNINNKWNDSKYVVYPNPTNETINIEFTNIEDANIQISNLSGQVILSRMLNTTTEKINISNYSKGVYFVKLTGKDFIKVEKIVKY